MKEKKPLLSISLLSSGRAKTIKKCLDSLVPLMEKVDSELIIVDTGCNEEIKKLMSVYTDKFVSFTWCDDFSKARNAGLEKATGEWFMYIDDDEWFVDTKAIEEFFLSGEYKKYFYACYIQRNYLKYNKQIYTDAWVSRMVRLEKNIRFVSSIHEYFYPLRDPYKLIHSMVEHFGYIYDTKEEERKHIKRNISLLLKMIEKEKGVIRWWTHLEQEYRAAEEYHQMQELCREGLEYFRNRNDFDTNRERGAFYCGLVEAELLSAYYEQAEKDVEKALTDKRNTQMCQMRLYNLGAEAYYKQGKYEEAEKCCEKYVEIYELLKDDEVERQNQAAFFVMSAFEPAGRNSALCFYILSGLHRGDTTALKKYFWEFGWNDVLMLYRGFVGEVIHFMSVLPYEEEFVRMAQTMVNRKGLQELWDRLLEAEKKGKNSAGEDGERFYRLARIFSQVTVPNHYVWYLKILYGDHIGNLENAEECYEKMFHYVADIFQLDNLVFAIAEKYQVNLSKQFEKIPFDQWRLGVDSFFSNSTYEKILEKTAIVRRSLPQENDTVSEKLAVRYDYFFMKAAEAEVVYGKNKKNLELLQESFRVFSDRCLAFYQQFYKENAFQGEMELLSPSCRVAVRLRSLLEAQAAGDRQRIGDCLKAAVGVFPDFDPAIKAYTSLYAAQEKAKLNAAAVSPEMQALAGQIKEKIRLLLTQDMNAEAYQVLQQLKTFLPNDPELGELERQISMKFS